MKVDVSEVDFPDGFDELVGACDADGDYVLSEVDGDKIILYPDSETNYPVKIKYLYNFGELDPDEDIPNGVSLGVLRAYLYALLNKENTRIERMVHEAQGLPTQFLDEATLDQKIIDAATDIEQRQPVLPVFSIRGLS
jgi:hypothetical protein